MSEPKNEKPEKERIRDALDVLQNYMTEDGRIDATKMTREIRQLKEERMTPARAKEVLEGMGLDVFDNKRLSSKYISADKNVVSVDYMFVLEELQAIALWMQDPAGVTNAQANTVEVVRDE